jgi:hypothetical protein
MKTDMLARWWRASSVLLFVEGGWLRMIGSRGKWPIMDQRGRFSSFSSIRTLSTAVQRKQTVRSVLWIPSMLDEGD